MLSGRRALPLHETGCETTLEASMSRVSEKAEGCFYRPRLRRFFLLCAAATGALGVSIVSDGVLTALRLPGAESSAQVLVPLASMAIEIACASILAFQLRRMAQRAAATAALLGTVS